MCELVEKILEEKKERIFLGSCFINLIDIKWHLVLAIFCFGFLEPISQKQFFKPFLFNRDKWTHFTEQNCSIETAVLPYFALKLVRKKSLEKLYKWAP